MTPEQVELVQRSFSALVETGAVERLGIAFYDRLFTLDPQLEELFTSDPVVQRTKFVDELEAIVWAVSNLDEFLQRTRELGERHLDYGVSARSYGTVGEALLDALDEVLGDRFNAEVSEAWTLAYNLVAETMMQAAGDAARRRGPEPS